MGQGLPTCDEDAACQKLEHITLLRKLLTFCSWKALGEVRKMTFLKKVELLRPELRDFYENHVAVNLDQSVSICAAEQGTLAWKQARLVRQKASKGRAQYTYFVNKKANWDARYSEVFESSWKGNERTARGILDEVSCRENFEENFMCSVLQSRVMVRPEVPRLSCSLDGTVLDKNGNFIRNLEIKSFVEGTRLSVTELIEMEAISTIDKNGNYKENTKHYAQVQLGMLFSGLDKCDYCVWSGVSEDFVNFKISFDEKHVLERYSRLVHVYFDKFLPRIFDAHCKNKNQNGDEDGEEFDD